MSNELKENVDQIDQETGKSSTPETLSSDKKVKKSRSKFKKACRNLYFELFIFRRHRFKRQARGMQRIKQKASNALVYVILTIISLIWVLPFVYLVLQSFAKSYSPQVLIPKEWTFDNYRALFDTNFKMIFNNKEMVFAEVYPFGRWLINTVLIALAVSILQTVLTLMSAYAFSRLNFGFRKKYMKLILIIGMFPGFLGMIITFYILKQ